MRSVAGCGLLVCLSAGGLSGVALGADTPTKLGVSHGRVVDVAHIYYNLATGERVVTLTGNGQSAGADAGGSSAPIWSSMVRNQCADQGFTNSFFFGMDNNANSSSLATAITLSEYGDIAANTVVDCVHINWVTDHDDVDNDSDGVGDGVVGLSGQWTWWDLDNGREVNACSRTPLIWFTLLDLPGDISGTTDPDDPMNVFASYSVDVDLAGSFSSSMTFEICDTDYDLQGAATHNPGIGIYDGDFDGLPDSDLDGDGLADWAWTIRFFQPGTADLDGDGLIDGDLADSFRDIGVNFGAPDGTAIDNGDGTWTWDIDTATSDSGTGAEDRFAIYAPPDLNGDIYYAGGFWFGGFKCEDDGSGEYTPAAMFEHQLFGPVGVCITCGCYVDFNNDGVANFFDVSIFLSDFAAGGDYNGDGVTNFFDVSSFLTDFAEGCP